MLELKINNDAFFKDAEELLRLFFGDEQITASSDNAEFKYALDINVNNNSATCSGSVKRSSDAKTYTDSCTEAIPEHCDSLELKRIISRCVKLAVFSITSELLPEIDLPWGAVTGIRPTKILYDCLASGKSLSEAVSELENVYHVTKNKTDLLKDILSMQEGLRGINPKKLVDIYIGIPFCPSRCYYCSFPSTDAKKFSSLMLPYVDALTYEMESAKQLMSELGLEADTVYIGGGTPTALTDELLEKVLYKANELFISENTEFSLEAGRPDTITESKLSIAKKYKVNRISVNPQTMNEETLVRIGRKHTVEDITKCMELVKGFHFNSINMDLIAGLTGETVNDFRHSVDMVCDLDPENITVHTLSVKRSSKLHEFPDRFSLVEWSDVSQMVDYARIKLTDNNWHPYYLYRQKYMTGNLENVGYTKTGKQCLYNINTMEETHTNIAMGAGAITKWLYPDRAFIARTANLRNVNEYISRIDEMCTNKRNLAYEFEKGDKQ